MLRMAFPKGANFGYLTQWDANLTISHVNSTPRIGLNGKTPYEVALKPFGEKKLLIISEL